MAVRHADFPDKKLFVRLFGPDVHAVGGYVRDLIRRRASDEVDLLVTRHPVEAVVRKLESRGRVNLVGRSFGVIKFTRGGRTYDLALPRLDRAVHSRSARSHKDIAVSADPFLPLEKDLERRDFRCNSIALRLSDGLVIDPFQGRKDIAERILRVTNAEAFPEDPLRVLRAARFASVLGFAPAPEIYDLSKRIDLSGLSVERVSDELFKLLLRSEAPSVGLAELFRLGALKQFLPEIYALTLAIHDPVFHPESDAYGNHTVWHHTLLTLDQASRLARKSELPPERALVLLLAALFHDAGKPEASAWEYKRGRMVLTNIGHDVRGEAAARRAFDRLKIFSWNGRDLRKAALLLVRHHHRVAEIWQNRRRVTRKAFNRLAHDAGGEIELLVLLDAADRAGRSPRPVRGLDAAARWTLRKFEELRVSRDTIKPLILGRDLIPLGVSPGPEMGIILKALYKMQLDNAFEDKAGGLKAARGLLRGGSKR
ncbi:MAG: HD domain-containing protein [Candidatus Aminicenantes bacterium]|nr:HD domain-containing protein [Candidatus Aminicenantes bacterium]